MTWRRGLKDICARLAPVGASRLPGWCPRDSSKRYRIWPSFAVINDCIVKNNQVPSTWKSPCNVSSPPNLLERKCHLFFFFLHIYLSFSLHSLRIKSYTLTLIH
ncbi:unnamed protein product [Trichobilharzia regenti]|nr:unnamed protein product [Trichobilharzia regenti]